MRPGELATALVWRIGMLADPEPFDAGLSDPQLSDPGQGWDIGGNRTFTLPPDPAELDLQPPDDLYDLYDLTVDDAAPGGRGFEPPGHVHHNDVDEDWLSGLEPPIHPEDAPHAVDTEVDVGRDRHLDAPPAPGERGGRPADPAHGAPSTASDVAVAVPGQPRDQNGVGKQSRPETGHGPLAAAETGSDVSRDRLLELNGQAAAFFTAAYPGSWAVGYLWERLGTDLSDDPRFPAGHAPASWTALTDHLRSLGASDPELLAAGLSSQARTGRLIDRFRDRLILPIQTLATAVDGGARRIEVVGFIGRRNPDTPDAGPKYLNTSETALFMKGAQLYGAAETAAELTAGATPVLVEGPLDAIAVTLAADGAAVGVAPLGTAFTDAQADSLRRYLGPGRPGVVVATDADEAGQKAAVRAYWQLTARGGNPTHLVMPDGHDPASLLQSAGPAALRQALTNPPTLARTLIDARVAQFADRMQHAEGPFLAV